MDDGLLKRKSIAECRICHDEDESTNLETPCACCGSLKFAHRECVQRWCNEKGDTKCEICRQGFEPGYTAPPHLFQFAALPIPLRGNWEIPRRNNAQGNFMLMIPTDRDFLEPNLDVHVSHATVICYRIVATIFVVLLILRHALPIIISEAGDYSVKLYSLFILGIIGVVVPAFLILKAISTLYRRRQRYRQASVGNIETANDEMNNTLRLQPQVHLIHIQ